MSQIPDSGDPGDVFGAMGMGPRKPELLTDATWEHLTSRFQLRGEIGSGGQAVVFEAKEQSEPHRKVALKVYHENSDAARRAFDNECRWLASPHLPQDIIVGYFQCESGDGLQPYLVLEFLDKGLEIHEYARTPRPMTPAQRIELFEKYLRTLQRLHNCNMVVGDVSARNVLVQPGDKIRFLDLAGAKQVARGYSASQSSLNIGTPGQVPMEVFSGDLSTSRTTDLIAAASVGFRVLTNRERSEVLSDAGLNDENHDDAPRLWDEELARNQVPAAVRRVLLKGLRKPDPRLAPDPHVYGSALQMADDIAAWRARQERRRTLRKQTLVTALLMLLVAIPGWIGWQKYLVAEAAADLKVWQSLQAETRELPNLSHPAVAKLVEDEKRLSAERDELLARNDQPGARAKLAEMLATSRETLNLAREIERAARLREAIGKVLLDESSSFNRNANGVRADGNSASETSQAAAANTAHADGVGVKRASGFWVTAAPVIDRRLAELQRMYQDLAKRIAAGEVARLSDDLGILQERLVELFNTNLEARAAFDARVGYEQLQRTVPERLRTQDGFQTIQAAARRAETAWSLTDWDQGRSLSLAKLQFGSAEQELAEWLEKNETAAEKSAREKDNQQRVQQLEAERQKLIADFNAKVEDVRKLNESFATLTQERLDDQKKLAAATTALTAEQKLRAESEAKVTEFDRTKTALAKAAGDLQAEKTRAAELSEQKKSAESNLATARSQTKTEKDRADRAEEQVKQLVVVANSGSADAAKRATEIAELNTKIAAVDTGNLKQAEETFAAAQQRYGTLDAERRELLTKYKADAPSVKAKDAELTVAGQQVEAALGKFDAAQQAVFQQYDSRLATQQTKLKKLTEGEGLLDTAAEVVAVRQAIDDLKQRQKPFAAGAARAAGTGKKLALTEIFGLSGGMAFGEKEIKNSVGMTLKLIPAGEFELGSPNSEENHQTDEGPVHRVKITKPFYMSTHEVTQGEYVTVMGNNPSHFSLVSGQDTKRFPVESVNWFDAVEFCNKLSVRENLKPCYQVTNVQHDGDHIKSATVLFNPNANGVGAHADGVAVKQTGAGGYRLPTEAEWEYAGRAGTKTPFHFGSVLNGDKANVDGNFPYGTTTKGQSLGRTTTVGSYAPNAFGLFDLHGNVWEWCDDVYDSSAYSKRSGVTTDPRVTSGSEYRVLRGGSWYFFSRDSRSAYRYGYSPDDRNLYIGFRVCR